VRDDGIPNLIASLRLSVWSRGLRIVDTAGGLRRDGLLALLTTWAATEEGDMMATCNAASVAQYRPAGVGDSPADTAVREWQAQPARWASVLRLADMGGERLKSEWRDIYRLSWRAGHAGDYVAGLAWVWDYYSGRTVDQGWFFDEHLPPLWSDCVAALKQSNTVTVAAPPVRWASSLPAWLHLLSVLPEESVKQLLPVAHHRYMAENPWYWPTSWLLFDVGRSQLWECEPVIPVIPEAVLRSWVPKS